jgi:putative transposase
MIEPNIRGLSVSRQCALLSISRSSFYYEPKGEPEKNLDLMQLIDKQFLETSVYGVRQMTWHLLHEDHLVSEKRIRRLMRLMGLMPIYQKPNNSKAAKGHKIYPYLPQGLRVDRPNQVRCADITYLPMRRGFLYLVAIMDWHTRKVLAWRISNTLEAEFCVEALKEAIHKFGPPDIMNTDQGSQFTSFARTDRLRRSSVRISMPLSDCAQSLAGNRPQRAVLGQHLCRTTVAEPEIGMCLLARLGNRIRGQSRRQKMDRVLQSQAPAFRTWRQTTRCSLLAEK